MGRNNKFQTVQNVNVSIEQKCIVKATSSAPINYIELINNFWNIHKEECFSVTEIALYFYLLSVSNSLGWKNPFRHTNTFVVGVLGISEKTLYNARKKLQEAGLIEFKSGEFRGQYSQYYLVIPKL